MFELLCLQTRAGGGRQLEPPGYDGKAAATGKREGDLQRPHITHKKARSLVSHFFFFQFAFRDYFLFLVLYTVGREISQSALRRVFFFFLGKYPIVHFRYIAACFPDFFFVLMVG